MQYTDFTKEEAKKYKRKNEIAGGLCMALALLFLFLPCIGIYTMCKPGPDNLNEVTLNKAEKYKEYIVDDLKVLANVTLSEDDMEQEYLVSYEQDGDLFYLIMTVDAGTAFHKRCEDILKEGKDATVSGRFYTSSSYYSTYRMEKYIAIVGENTGTFADLGFEFRSDNTTASWIEENKFNFLMISLFASCSVICILGVVAKKQQNKDLDAFFQDNNDGINTYAKDLIEKKLAKEKVLRFGLIGYLLLFIVVLVMGWDWVLFATISPAIIAAIYYFARLLPILINAKQMAKKGMDNEAGTILVNKPTLPRMRVYCGNKALFNKNNHSILPYHQILWVYKYRHYVNGMLVEESIVLKLNTGKTVKLAAADQEFMWLLQNHIGPNSPNLIIGAGKQEAARYKQLRKES